MGSEVRLETQVERGLGFLDAHHIHRLFIVHIFAFQKTRKCHTIK